MTDVHRQSRGSNKRRAPEPDEEVRRVRSRTLPAPSATQQPRSQSLWNSAASKSRGVHHGLTTWELKIPASITNLPNDLILMTLGYLDLPQILAFTSTCHQFRSFLDERVLLRGVPRQLRNKLSGLMEGSAVKATCRRAILEMLFDYGTNYHLFLLKMVREHSVVGYRLRELLGQAVIEAKPSLCTTDHDHELQLQQKWAAHAAVLRKQQKGLRILVEYACEHWGLGRRTKYLIELLGDRQVFDALLDQYALDYQAYIDEIEYLLSKGASPDRLGFVALCAIERKRLERAKCPPENMEIILEEHKRQQTELITRVLQPPPHNKLAPLRRKYKAILFPTDFMRNHLLKTYSRTC